VALQTKTEKQPRFLFVRNMERDM